MPATTEKSTVPDLRRTAPKAAKPAKREAKPPKAFKPLHKYVGLIESEPRATKHGASTKLPVRLVGRFASNAAGQPIFLSKRRREYQYELAGGLVAVTGTDVVILAHVKELANGVYHLTIQSIEGTLAGEA